MKFFEVVERDPSNNGLHFDGDADHDPADHDPDPGIFNGFFVISAK